MKWILGLRGFSLRFFSFDVRIITYFMVSGSLDNYGIGYLTCLQAFPLSYLQH